MKGVRHAGLGHYISHGRFDRRRAGLRRDRRRGGRGRQAGVLRGDHPVRHFGGCRSGARPHADHAVALCEVTRAG